MQKNNFDFWFFPCARTILLFGPSYEQSHFVFYQCKGKIIFSFYLSYAVDITACTYLYLYSSLRYCYYEKAIFLFFISNANNFFKYAYGYLYDCVTTVQCTYYRHINTLKVVGNEKEGGPGKWQMLDIYLGLWWSMPVCLCIQPPSCFKSISFSAYSSPIIKRWPTD